MTQIHSCMSHSTFCLPRKFYFHYFQIYCMESLRILEKGSRYTLVQNHLARWTSLFLCHFFHERCQRHNPHDGPGGTESSQFYVKMIQFFENYCLYDAPLSRPTLVFEVILSCRLVLNLRSAAGESSASKIRPAILPWSDNSKTGTSTNPSTSIIVGDQSLSTDLQVASTLGTETKLEPNRKWPESTWNTQTLYTNNE